MAGGRKRSGAGARRLSRRTLTWSIRALLAFLVASSAWVLLYRFIPPPITLTQMGDLLGGRSIARDWMSIEAIDRDMVRAVIAAEDSKFCSHKGFDGDAIAEAMRRNARGGSVIRGGSTISQQTAKNAFLWQGGGYFRKAIEAWFTFLIEKIWGKKRIMEIYLNIAETGIGTYGVNAGAQRYFGVDASTLSRTQAARLAAVLPLPKKRGAVTPKGFTRRYGNSIAARIAVVARQDLDTCIYAGWAPRQPLAPEPPPPARKRTRASESDVPADPVLKQDLPGEEYEMRQEAAPEPDPLLIPDPPATAGGADSNLEVSSNQEVK